MKIKYPSHPAKEPFYLEDAVFTNSSGNTTTWANAVANNKLYGYLAYYDSAPSLAKDRKYKYASISSLGVDDSNLQPKTGYWVYAKEAGTLNLPGAGGTLSGETYDLNKLRFSNGTDELNISDAIAAGTLWVQDKLWYIGYYYGDRTWRHVTSSGLTGKTYFEPWEGYFIWSYKDNITLIRQN